MKRLLRLALSASMFALCLGPSAPAALAQAATASRLAPATPIVPTVALPRLAPGLTMSRTLLPQAASALLAGPALPAASAASAPAGSAAQVTPFARTMTALEAPALQTQDMSASESSDGAAKDFAARIGQASPVELLVSAPNDSAHRLTQTIYPASLARPGSNLKDIELSLHSQLSSFGLSKKMLTAYNATAVGAVSQINTVVLNASADQANAFKWALRALGYNVQEGRKFDIPKPQRAEPMSRTVGLKEMAAVIGADKLQAELAKVLGEPTTPGRKSSLISRLGHAARRILGLAVENPVLPWAVLDSWVSVRHPFLKGHFIKSVTNDDDGQSHGTHTSGTVVGMDRWNYAGRNYNIFPQGSATEGDILFKLNMAQEDGALATTNSWGDGGGNPEGAIEKLFVKTAQAGMHHSISAGNSGSRANTVGGPAIAYENVDLTLFGKTIGKVKRIKAIAASDADKRTASFSSRGPGSRTTAQNPERYKDYPVKPDEAGVGVNLVAPVPKGANVPELGGPGGTMSGTSMSNPGVFGGFLLLTRAILVLLRDGLPAGSTAERTQIAMDLARYAMTQTAEKVAPATEVGDGFINVWNAFQFAAKTLKDAAPKKALPALRAWARGLLGLAHR
ncbi:MAG: S8 family serine peptidase [Elusimicrobiota bacterium]